MIQISSLHGSHCDIQGKSYCHFESSKKYTLDSVKPYSSSHPINPKYMSIISDNIEKTKPWNSTILCKAVFLFSTDSVKKKKH